MLSTPDTAHEKICFRTIGPGHRGDPCLGLECSAYMPDRLETLKAYMAGEDIGHFGFSCRGEDMSRLQGMIGKLLSLFNKMKLAIIAEVD